MATKKTLTDEAKKAAAAKAKRERAAARRAAAKGQDPGLVEVRPGRAKRTKQQRIDDAIALGTKPKRSRNTSQKVEDRSEDTSRSSRVSSEETDPLADLRPKPGARGCHGTNLMGNPCGGITVNAGTKMKDRKGKEHVAGGGYCIVHDPSLPDHRELNVGGPQANAGPKPKKNPVEILTAAFAQSSGLFMAPYLKALGLKIDARTGDIVNDPDNDGVMLFGTSKDGDVFVSDYADIGTQVKVAEMLQDRIFGKPKQQTELSGKDGANLVVEVPMTKERVTAVASVLEQVGAIPKAKGKKT